MRETSHLVLGHTVVRAVQERRDRCFTNTSSQNTVGSLAQL